MTKRKKKPKRKATPKPPRLNDGDRLIQTAVQNIKTTH